MVNNRSEVPLNSSIVRLIEVKAEATGIRGAAEHSLKNFGEYAPLNCRKLREYLRHLHLRKIVKSNCDYVNENKKTRIIKRNL